MRPLGKIHKEKQLQRSGSRPACSSFIVMIAQNRIRGLLRIKNRISRFSVVFSLVLKIEFYDFQYSFTTFSTKLIFRFSTKNCFFTTFSTLLRFSVLFPFVPKIVFYDFQLYSSIFGCVLDSIFNSFRSGARTTPAAILWLNLLCLLRRADSKIRICRTNAVFLLGAYP